MEAPIEEKIKEIIRSVGDCRRQTRCDNQMKSKLRFCMYGTARD